MATSALAFENFYDSTVNETLTDSDLTITLTDAPTINEGFMVIDPDGAQEIVYFTSRSGNDITCPSGAGNGRGYDGTTAAAHASGTRVIYAPVAAILEAFKDGTAFADDFLDSRHYVAGSIDTAHIADKNVTAEKLGQPVAFSAYLSADQTGIADATDTTVEFDTEYYDLGSNFDTSTYTFTAPYDGIYHFEFVAHMVLYDNDALRVSIVGGNESGNATPTLIRQQRYVSRDNATNGSAVGGLMRLDANDTVVAKVLHGRGVATSLTSGSFSRFTGHLVGRI